jgi:hypothetical protein
MSDFSIGCAFVVPPSADHDCHQHGLFRAEYQRANRMHGVKVSSPQFPSVSTKLHSRILFLCR